MRMTVILVVALALLGSTSAQRPSRLQQMVRGFMDDMNDMASRIGTGMLKSFNSRPGLSRENRPAVLPGRKRQRPVPLDDLPARQSNENLVAPNDPQRPRPVLRQERPRLTFRQFVDGTMAGLRNLFPGLTRRSFHRSARDVQQ
ncbi:uncharacterized protein LOC122244223 [Penaeus japonicus]|uniref:uncharacterized protein LOC122244223 n=1 Tax=Penaeus japonicus TaxID=27405 RepID=UPI001C7122B0|nr:uncharacterized protein LOC122244223 [Penaeus japonicus]